MWRWLAVLVIFLSSVPAVAKPMTLLALGDSLTAGYGLPAGQGFPVKLEAALRAKGHDVTVVNGGVAGDTAGDGLARLDWSLTGSETAVIVGEKVRVVGIVDGLHCFAGPYVFCSLRTARRLLHMNPAEAATFVVARCPDPQRAIQVAEDLRRYDDMTVFTRDEFSFRTRLHWLTTTKAGIALGLSAVLGLLVGAVVTSQTLYSATVTSFREYATLEALGIPRWRIGVVIVTQAFWIGISGILLGLPITLGLAHVAELFQVRVLLPIDLLAGAGVITLLMAIVAGLAALRSLRHIDVYSLLR